MKSKILQIFLSLLISFGLWFYVISVERTETEKTFRNIPVTFDGESVLEDRGLRLTSDTDITVDLTLAGNRSTLNKLSKSDITVLVDLSKIREAGEKNLTYDVEITAGGLVGSIEVAKRDPVEIKLTVAQWASKDIPVVAAPTNEELMPEDYIIDWPNVKLEYNDADIESINVSGPKELIDQIAGAKVEVDMTGRTESVEQRLNVILCDQDGDALKGDLSAVAPTPYKLLVKVPVLMVKEVPIVMPEPLKGGGLNPADVEIALEYESITVVGSPAMLAGVSTLTLDRIDLSKETDSFVDRVYTVDLPTGVRTTSGAEEVEVKVSLTLPPVEIKKLEIPTSQVERLNVPSDVFANIYEPKLQVWIRGRGTILSQIRETDIKVSVDLTGATQNGYYPVTVTIKNYDNVGVITDPYDADHTYQLYIKIVPLADILPGA